MKKNLDRIKSVAVYCGSRSPVNPVFEDAAIKLGRFIAEQGMTLVFGGSNVGTMKTLSDAALAAGGKVVGVFTTNLPMSLAHPRLTELVVTNSLAERKKMMIERADALVALPGGLGTLDELFDALALRRVKTGGHKKPVGVLNVNGYYDKLLDFIVQTRDLGFSSNAAAQTLVSGKTPEELFDRLVGSLPPKVNEETQKDDLKALWRTMARDKEKYGVPGGAPFADAFYEVARSYPLASWRNAGREITFQMLMWVDDMYSDIFENLDCSSFDEHDWAELFMENPLLIRHPQCPKDLHPLDVLYCINSDIRCLQYVDMNEFISELLPEYGAEYVWSPKDVEKARDMGANAFADWLEKYAVGKEVHPSDIDNRESDCTNVGAEYNAADSNVIKRGSRWIVKK